MMLRISPCIVTVSISSLIQIPIQLCYIVMELKLRTPWGQQEVVTCDLSFLPFLRFYFVSERILKIVSTLLLACLILGTSWV